MLAIPSAALPKRGVFGPSIIADRMQNCDQWLREWRWRLCKRFLEPSSQMLFQVIALRERASEKSIPQTYFRNLHIGQSFPMS
jgi:hypothetical protein